MKRKPFLPGYAWLLLLIVPVWTEILYYGARLLNRGRTHLDFSCGLDRVIPAVPWTIVIYSVCYLLFWVVNYVLCARGEKRDAYRFFCADFLAKAVCFFLFLLLPATMERPVIDGNSLWDDALRLLYQIDAPDNLFPSIHCLVSWFSYIGVRGRKDIPRWYRMLSLAMALAVFVSTLTTRQHVIADIFGGVLLAESCYWLAGWKAVLERYTQFINGLLRRLQDVVPIREPICHD